MDEFKSQQFYRPLTGTEIRLTTIRHPIIARIGEDYHQAVRTESFKSMFDRIECQLDYALLEVCPEFAALSYVWGDQNDKFKL